MSNLRPFLLILVLLAGDATGAQMRSRAEGVMGVQASNTVGLGDIWVTGGLSTQFRVKPIHVDRLSGMVDSAYAADFRKLYGPETRLERDLLFLPSIGATIGLAQYLHLELHTVPWDGDKIGGAGARLKLTTPGNDNLRLFGLGLCLNATLSTEEDVYSRGETTPGFDPVLYVSATADVDLVKIAPGWPFKAYLNYAGMDDYRLARAYSQHRFQFALEHKGAKKGWYLRGAASLYKPLPTRFDPAPDGEWLPPVMELGVGWRSVVAERFTLTADASMDPIRPLSFYDREVRKPPRVQVEVEAPLVFTETRAEAIRALIFNERERKRYRELAAKNPAPKALKDSVDSRTGNLKLDEVSLEERKMPGEKDLLEGVFEEKEEDVSDKRRQIRTQLRQIEELLE